MNTRLDEDTRLGRNNAFNYSLRNSEDEIEPQPCKGCGQPLRTYKDEVRHEIKHVQEGTFIAWVGTVTSSLLVHFTPKKDERYVGGVVIPFEHLDWSTNRCRVVCRACGNFCYFGYRDGKWYWKHYKRMRWTGRDWVRSSADDNEYYPDHEVDLPLPEPPEEQG